MRRLITLCALLSLVCAMLTGCSAGWNSVPGIGLDAAGQLIGAVKVCDHTISRASIETAKDSQVGAWKRKGSLRHTETWQLAPAASGPWTASVRLPATLPPDQTLTFAAARDDAAYNSRWIYFHASDIARLKPGELLINRQVSTGHDQNTTTELAVIPLVDFDQQPCPTY